MSLKSPVVPSAESSAALSPDNVSRADYSVIADWITPGSRVLDLGCGDGALLQHLQVTRQITGYGIELDDVHIPQCINAGINVIQSDLDQGLSEFDHDSFDVVILSLTLQAIKSPDHIISEMLRVGTQGIVSLPNMGHWKSRLQIGFTGRMPVSRSLPNAWYDTPNIRLCTLHDFEALCAKKAITIEQRYTLQSGPDILAKIAPNFFSEIALYRFSRF